MFIEVNISSEFLYIYSQCLNEETIALISRILNDECSIIKDYIIVCKDVKPFDEVISLLNEHFSLIIM